MLFNAMALMMIALSVERVEGYAEWFVDVICLDEDPSICIGEREVYGPSPILSSECFDEPIPDDCEVTYRGGFMWISRFVTGLQEGSETYELTETEREEHFTGLEITVRMEDNYTCSVKVGNETCDSCTSCYDEGIPYYADTTSTGYAFTADCTNIDNGKTVECMSAEDPFFYPLETTTPSPRLPKTTKNPSATSKYMSVATENGFGGAGGQAKGRDEEDGSVRMRKIRGLKSKKYS